MDIVVTESGQSYLQSKILDGMYIRIRAYDTYSCSTMVEYDLTLDNIQQDDSMVTVGSLKFIYDSKAQSEIGSYIKIDYVPSQGLKLINKNQTLAYGLQLKNL